MTFGECDGRTEARDDACHERQGQAGRGGGDEAGKDEETECGGRKGPPPRLLLSPDGSPAGRAEVAAGHRLGAGNGTPPPPRGPSGVRALSSHRHVFDHHCLTRRRADDRTIPRDHTGEHETR